MRRFRIPSYGNTHLSLLPTKMLFVALLALSSPASAQTVPVESVGNGSAMASLFRIEPWASSVCDGQSAGQVQLVGATLEIRNCALKAKNMSAQVRLNQAGAIVMAEVTVDGMAERPCLNFGKTLLGSMGHKTPATKRDDSGKSKNVVSVDWTFAPVSDIGARVWWSNFKGSMTCHAIACLKGNGLFSDCRLDVGVGDKRTHWPD